MSNLFILFKETNKNRNESKEKYDFVDAREISVNPPEEIV